MGEPIRLLAELGPEVLPGLVPWTLLQQLGVGVVLLFAAYSPVVLALIRGWLRPGAQFKEVIAEADKRVAAAEAREAATEARLTSELAAARQAHADDKRDLTQAWREERERGDRATLALADAGGEISRVTHKLVEIVTQSGDNGVEHAPQAISDGHGH